MSACERERASVSMSTNKHAWKALLQNHAFTMLETSTPVMVYCFYGICMKYSNIFTVHAREPVWFVAARDNCIGVTCQNGGTCVSLELTFRCQCVLGFEGDNCETSQYSHIFALLYFKPVTYRNPVTSCKWLCKGYRYNWTSTDH